MESSQSASRSEEPTSHNGEVPCPGPEIARNEHTDIPTHVDLSSELAWTQQNLLSLDGGGIRGYWTLLVLQYLMECIAEEEKVEGEEHHSFFPEHFPSHVTQGDLNKAERDREESFRGPTRAPTHHVVRDVRKFLPCHYFDYICGSSTGGLIAIMLGRFRMSVWDCLQEYRDMSHSIFGKPRFISRMNLGLPWNKYSANAMEQAFKEVTARRCEKHTQSNVTFKLSNRSGSSNGICKTFVTSFAYERQKNAQLSERRLYHLRTYNYANRDGLVLRAQRRTNTATTSDNEREYGPDWEIWKVARAGTAAPFYFKELPEERQMRGTESTIYFADGGFAKTNNPTNEGLIEISKLHGKENWGPVVNIGTSRSTLKPGGRSAFKRVKSAFDIATDPATVANVVEDLNLPYYWRFNDEDGIDVDLDEWKPTAYFTKNSGTKTLEKIQNKFNAWALQPHNREDLSKCAKELVRRRRARIRNQAKWKVYATNASFACRQAGCNSEAFHSHITLRDHLRNDHSIQESELQTRVDEATQMWQYQKPPGKMY